MTSTSPPECQAPGWLAIDELVLATEVPRLDVEYRASCLMTNGPSWSVQHPYTERWMTVAYRPESNTFRVWSKGTSWDGVRPRRLREACNDVKNTWSDTWSRDRELADGLTYKTPSGMSITNS